MNEGTQLDLPSWLFTRPFHITMALFQLHQGIRMKRYWSIINLRISVTLSISKRIFLCFRGTYQLILSLWLKPRDESCLFIKILWLILCTETPKLTLCTDQLWTFMGIFYCSRLDCQVICVYFLLWTLLISYSHV